MDRKTTCETESERREISPRLVAALRDGDCGAFETIHARYRKPLEQFLYSLLRNRHQAEDAAQEIFIRIWEKRARLDPTKNFKTYLFVAARNTVMNIFGHQKVVEKALGRLSMGETTGQNQEDTLIAKETRLLIDLAISRMPHTRRMIYEMSYYEQLSNEEIAQRLNLSKANVANHLFQARQYLKEIVTAIAIFLAIQ